MSNSHMSSDIWGHTFTHHLTSGTCGLTAGLYQRIHPLKILFIQEFKNLLKLARPKLQMTFYTKLPMFLPVLSETVCGLTWYHHGNDLPLLQPLHDWFTMNGLTTYSLKIELVDNYINLFDKKKELKETYQQQISKMERKDTSFHKLLSHLLPQRRGVF